MVKGRRLNGFQQRLSDGENTLAELFTSILQRCTPRRKKRGHKSPEKVRVSQKRNLGATSNTLPIIHDSCNEAFFKKGKKNHYFICQVHREQNVLHCVRTPQHVAFNEERSAGKDQDSSFEQQLLVLILSFGNPALAGPDFWQNGPPTCSFPSLLPCCPIPHMAINPCLIQVEVNTPKKGKCRAWNSLCLPMECSLRVTGIGSVCSPSPPLQSKRNK